MNSRERVMAALTLNEPDCVPFVDWIDAPAKKKLINAIGTQALDEADFAAQLNMDALCCSPEAYLAPGFCKKAIGADGRERTAAGCRLPGVAHIHEERADHTVEMERPRAEPSVHERHREAVLGRRRPRPAARSCG